MSEYHCEKCGKHFEGQGKRRFCSLECRYADSRKEERVCPTCNAIFLSYKSKRNRRSYCSPACVPKVEKKPMRCAGCGKEFMAYESQKGLKYCSKECRAKVKSAMYTCEHCGVEFRGFTKKPPRFCSRECQKAHARIDTTCPNCGKAFWYHASWPRIYCSRECSNAVNATNNLGAYAITGEENPFWDGGTFPYYGPNWRSQRDLARQRDNYECQHCHISEKKLDRELHVHHIVKLRYFGENGYIQANELSNLITLCAACHKKVECGNLPLPSTP